MPYFSKENGWQKFSRKHSEWKFKCLITALGSCLELFSHTDDEKKLFRDWSQSNCLKDHTHGWQQMYMCIGTQVADTFKEIVSYYFTTYQSVIDLPSSA